MKNLKNMELVVAVDREWGIGYKGDLLVRVRADLRRFKELTVGKTVILGSNTLSTFPGGKPLKNRKNLILHPLTDYKVEGAQTVHSIDELLRLVEQTPEETFVVIGGASVYRQLLPYCSTAYVTKFDRVFEKDVCFEDLDALPEWKALETGEEQKAEKEDGAGDLTFRFLIYKRNEEHD